MDKNITGLKPEAIWKNFYALTQIPRPSKKEAAIIEYMINWAKERNLEVQTDKVQNVIIRKPATKGMEDKRGVILQSHLDMVPQKNNDKNHDFEKDPITAYIDGEWVTADGTTLGADNGIGVAAAMSVLEANDLEHGPIEALLTIDEETGMTGAFNLDPNILKGDILLNMDSEDEGELYIGCAGGIDVTMEDTYKTTSVKDNSIAVTVTVTGLKGGHSGIDIPLQRGNANKILFRFLQLAQKQYKIQIAEVAGGDMRNAIPREATAVICFASKERENFEETLSDYNEIIKKELEKVDAGVVIKAEECELPEEVMNKKSSHKLISLVRAIPHGPIRFIDGMKDIPETSTNLAIVTVKDGRVFIANLLRSSTETGKRSLVDRMKAIFRLAGHKAKTSGAYPGWKPNFDSAILETMKKVYNDKYGKIPEVKIIHAGLECGILGSIYNNWDMISFGPTIRFPHSPDEKVNIATVGTFWDYLVETLKNIPKK